MIEINSIQSNCNMIFLSNYESTESACREKIGKLEKALNACEESELKKSEIEEFSAWDESDKGSHDSSVLIIVDTVDLVMKSINLRISCSITLLDSPRKRKRKEVERENKPRCS